MSNLDKYETNRDSNKKQNENIELDFSRMRVKLSISTLIATLTLAVAMSTFVYSNYFTARKRADELEKRLMQINIQNEQIQDKIMNTISNENNVNERLFKEIEYKNLEIGFEKVVDIERLIDKAEFASEHKDLDRAISLTQESLDIQQNPYSYYYLAKFHFLNNKHNESIEYLRKAIDLDSEKQYNNMNFALGSLLYMNNQIAESKKYLKLFVEENTITNNR